MKVEITKDGSKWLRPVDMYDERHVKDFALPYTGSRPEGTVVDESEVREVRQFKDNGEWVETSYENYMEDDELGLPVRTAYTDAEPPDIDYEKEMSHKKWPSTKYVARKVDAESHGRHISDDYWRKRCELAEQLVGIGFLHIEFMSLLDKCGKRGKYDEWQQIVKQEPK